MTIKHGVKSSIEAVRKEFESRGMQLLSTVYANALTPLDYICHCGTKSKIRLSKLKMGQECINCARRKTRAGLMTWSFEEVAEILSNFGHTLIEWNGTNAQSKYTCKCGNLVKVKIEAMHMTNYRACPDCIKESKIAICSRGIKEYFEWQARVREIYDNTCVACGKPGSTTHHVITTFDKPELYLEEDNGVVMCKSCHSHYHGRYPVDINKASLELYIGYEL